MLYGWATGSILGMAYYQYVFENSGTTNVTVPVYNGTYYIVVVTNGHFYFDSAQTVTVNGAAESVTVNI